MADYVSGAIGEIFKCAYSHIEREIGYFVQFRTNTGNLKFQVELLSAKRNDVKEQIRQATMNGEAILNTVETWLNTSGGVLGRATSLDEKAAAIDRCFKGWFCSRFRLSRSAQKEILMVQRLLNEVADFGERVSCRIPVQDLVTAPVVILNAIGSSLSDNITAQNLVSSAELKSFGVRITTAKQIIEALGNDGTSLFGVYGMAGVGKTTLITSLASHVKEQKIFDEVVVVPLTLTPEVESIQDIIANGLDLKFDDRDIFGTKALRLSQRLSQDQKTLIILDNLWKEITLAEVGIPQGLKNCKVLFTTRDTDVCNSMDTGESRIKIDVLSPEDSWNLFRMKTGDMVDSLDFQSVARDVLNECQGLPLLIVALGKALYQKNRTYWDAALQALHDSTILPNPNFLGLPKVFSVMKLSYDYLESEETKLCFLFCCLFPEGYHISMEQLFHYIIGEKILTKASTLQTARLHLHVIVDKLISSCLLLQAKSGCIMMHDVVRDVALAIASDPREGNGFIVKAGVQLNEWPNMQLDDCKRLSFITTRGNHMSWSFPNQIRAVHLLTLSFHGNERLVKIPSGFFEETPNLLAVDLSYTGIKVLPQSIMSLGKLHTLLLEGCLRLNDVYLSNTMERLEILNLRYSAVESVMVSPKMTTIKLLDLSNTSKLEHIGQNIISSFIELEELYLFESFRAWEPERIEPRETGGRVSKGKDVEEGPGTSSAGTERREDSARLSEVTLLPRLTSLELHVGNLECLFQSIPNWENLTRFKIAVGVIDDFSPAGIDDGLQMEKSMYIELDSRVIANWVKVLLGKTNFLQLKGSQSLTDLLRLDQGPEQQIFCELKVLILSKIGPQSLIVPSPIERVSSAVKKVLKLSDGVRFTSLIACDLLVRLQNLNKLVIMNCKYIDKLIQFDSEDQAVASSSSRLHMVKFRNVSAFSVFPNLTYLRVCACAELRYLFSMKIILCLSQLQMLHISDCQRMEMVTVINENAEDVGKAGDGKAILPKLKILSLESLKTLSLIIQQDVHLELAALEELKVEDCGGLKKLPFGPGSVPQLSKLVVDDDWFDELIWDDQNVKQRLLRLLNSLQLKGYGSLKDVELHDQWHPTSKSVRVIEYKGSTLVPCSFLKKMPHLTELVIKNSRELQIIDFGEEDDTVEKEMHSAGSSSLSANTSKFIKPTPYPMSANLSCLKVSGCSSLKYLCSVRVIGGLLQLEKLYIHDCSEMEMMIKHENNDKMILPKLRILSLHSLGSLSCIVLKSGHLELPALEELKVKGCEKLMYRLSNAYHAPRLHTKLQWENRTVDNIKEVVELDESWHLALVRFLNVSNYQGATIVHCGLLGRMWNLEKLAVSNCPNLEAIIEYGGETKAGNTAIIASSSSVKNKDISKLSSCLVFSNLTFLFVSFCDKLRYLLPVAVVRNMAQLIELHVSYCNSMEAIIEYENVEDGGDAEKDKGLLPKLEKLTLRELPKLSSFAGRDILFDWPSLTQIEVYNCLALKKLPLGRGSVPKLESCSLDPKEWSDELIWEDEQLKSRLHSLPRSKPFSRRA